MDSVWGHRAPNAEGHRWPERSDSSEAGRPAAHFSMCGIHALLPGGSPLPVEGQQMRWSWCAWRLGGTQGALLPVTCRQHWLMAGPTDRGGTPRSSQRCVESPACCHSIAIVTARTDLPCSRHCPCYEGHRFYLMMFSKLFPMHMCPYFLPYNVVTCSAD